MPLNNADTQLGPDEVPPVTRPVPLGVGNGPKPSGYAPPKPGAPRLSPTDRLALLEPRGPNNPSADELATCAAEGDEGAPVPPAVQALIGQLATALDALDARSRAAALRSIAHEVAKRRAS